jgi:hypothetical protein
MSNSLKSSQHTLPEGRNKMKFSGIEKLAEVKIPRNLKELLEEEDFWECEDYLPLRLTIEKSVQNDKEVIHHQVDFEPGEDEFTEWNTNIQKWDIEPDGYGWSEVIRQLISSQNSSLEGKVLDDSEKSTCVLYTLELASYRKLLKAIGRILMDPSRVLPSHQRDN